MLIYLLYYMINVVVSRESSRSVNKILIYNTLSSTEEMCYLLCLISFFLITLQLIFLAFPFPHSPPVHAQTSQFKIRLGFFPLQIIFLLGYQKQE